MRILHKKKQKNMHAHTHPSSNKMTPLSIVCINVYNNKDENEPSDVHVEPKMMKMLKKMPVNAVI